MSKKKKIIWFLLVVFFIVGIVFFVRSRKTEIIYTTEIAQKGSLVQTVSATGDLTDEKEIVLNFEIGGRIGKIFVHEGQQVAAGDSIATIDNPILEAQVLQAKNSLDSSIAKAGLNNDEIREMEVSVENAENVLDDTKKLNEENLATAEKIKSNAKTYYEAAESYYNQVVAENGASSSLSKSAYLTLQSAKNSYENSQKSVEVAEKQADLAKTNAQNSLDLGEARLKTLKSQYTKKFNDSSVLSAEAAHQIALENLAKATLKSPVNGIVAKINNKAGEILGTGVLKESFTKIIANDFILESNIPESDIMKISLGDKAKITFDALDSEDPFAGEVVQIDPNATVIQDVVYYRIKLKLESFPNFRSGMSANIDIVTSQKNEVIKIPTRSVKIEDNRKYVEILEEKNQIKKVFVQTGIEGDEGMVEISSGLLGGEEIITFVPSE